MPRDYSKEICAYLRSIDISLGKLSKSLERIADRIDEEKMAGTYSVIAPAIDKDTGCSSFYSTLKKVVDECKEEQDGRG